MTPRTDFSATVSKGYRGGEITAPFRHRPMLEVIPMDVQGLTGLDCTPNRSDEMVQFFRDVMSMTQVPNEAQVAGFQKSDGT
jgi:hypothetical protein